MIEREGNFRIPQPGQLQWKNSNRSTTDTGLP